MKYFFSFFLLLFLLSACTRGVDKKLKMAENLVKSESDSSLVVLDEIYEQYDLLSDKEKAIFGLLYYETLNKNNEAVYPIDIINNSIEYYKKVNNNNKLAYAYLYKAKVYKRELGNNFTTYIFKSLETAQKALKKDETLLGMIYADLGFLAYCQREYSMAYENYMTALDHFTHTGEKNKLANVLIGIGNTLVGQEQHESAFEFYSQALHVSMDEVITGMALLSLARNYYALKQYDWALHYALQSLEYPVLKNNEPYRYYLLADIYFDIDEFEEAIVFAKKALSISMDYVTARDCYRILVNAEYNINRQSPMIGLYMRKFQDYNDSVNLTIYAPNVLHVENSFQSQKQIDKTNNYNFALIIGVIIISVMGFILISLISKKGRQRQNTAEENYRKQLRLSAEQQKEEIKIKIRECKEKYSEKRKGMNADERNKLDKEIYQEVIFVDNETEFIRYMNKSLNGLPDKLKSAYPSISYKELMWCCLSVIDVPLFDMAIILEYTHSTIYKFKQRFAKKLKVGGAKELDTYLENLLYEEYTYPADRK